MIPRVRKLTYPYPGGETYAVFGELLVNADEKAYLDYFFGTISLYVTGVSNPEYLTTGDVCQLLGVTRETLWAWHRNGYLVPDTRDAGGYKYLAAKVYDLFTIRTMHSNGAARRKEQAQARLDQYERWDISGFDHDPVTDPEHADEEPQDSPESGSV